MLISSNRHQESGQLASASLPTSVEQQLTTLVHLAAQQLASTSPVRSHPTVTNKAASMVSQERNRAPDPDHRSQADGADTVRIAHLQVASVTLNDTVRAQSQEQDLQRNLAVRLFTFDLLPRPPRTCQGSKVTPNPGHAHLSSPVPGRAPQCPSIGL